ncbi:MAG: tyrosine--tRNA ligase [Patescibacteria group bacterium]|nr:tyrosine--tRNA ligase [Patescibacteria group bacterium]
MLRRTKNKEILERGVEQVIVKANLAKRLDSGEKLRVKLGIDPTSPLLHLGHTVVLRKLKQFQDLGHQAIFLVGDFTARIGDPTDKVSARQPLSPMDIQENVATYREQVGKILDLSKVEFRYNSEWHKNMDLAEFFQLASLFSVNQMLERDMFQKRMSAKKPLWIHELMYPLLQGYDSVALRADVELGGTDQTFNILAGRVIQPAYKQDPQDILTVPLLAGLDGNEKMSKSVGNTVNLNDSPKEMFGRLMSIPDRLIVKYFTLLTDESLADIAGFDQAMKNGANPRDLKAQLAKEIVELYHSKHDAIAAEKEFVQMFKNKQAPDEMPVCRLKNGRYALTDLLVAAKLASSKAEARRVVEQGGVSVDSQIIKDWKKTIIISDGMVVKVGKRKFVKLVN